MRKRIISILTVLSVLLTLIPASAINAAIPDDGIGRVEISTIPLPSDVAVLEIATYTYSGKVLIAYKTANDINTTEYHNIAVMNDDGTSFKKIFSGVIPVLPKAGGFDCKPFQDNKRVLMTDYVLECTPDIDSCTSAKVVQIAYPSILADDPKTTVRSSSTIIAPDNKHAAWTMIRSDIGAAVAYGTLTRNPDNYTIENTQLISTVPYFINDPNKAGYIIPQTLRGGEVKEFVNGGMVISVAGQKIYNTADSIIQDLTSSNLTQITYTPGYDETTISSFDGCLGMTLTTRFSPKTDAAIFGIMPRPYPGYTSMGISTFLYTHGVTGVRSSREGNIGPALINLSLSQTQVGYKGVNLNTDPNWVFCSPMSWHPDSKRAMWLEMYRGDSTKMRLQKVKLLDYCPKAPVPVVTSPDNIPYGTKDLTILSTVSGNVSGKIAGKKCGYIDYVRQVNPDYTGKTETTYVNFSDDGLNFYNGYEKLNYNYSGESRYESNIQLTGSKPGIMNFRATYGPVRAAKPAELLFDIDTDGNPKSFGTVTYNGVTLNISDLIP
ncbi:hypothetical protein [Anaerocolumna jejuensis]|uniref:hypothetical protein n=1 Tax=Anaerocolumna jejuensis TaxID=259063 RepID=UPI003F7B7AE4